MLLFRKKARRCFHSKNVRFARFFSLRRPTTFLRFSAFHVICYDQVYSGIPTRKGGIFCRFISSSFSEKRTAALTKKKRSLVPRSVFSFSLAYHFFPGRVCFLLGGYYPFPSPPTVDCHFSPSPLQYNQTQQRRTQYGRRFDGWDHPVPPGRQTNDPNGPGRSGRGDG